MYISINVSFSDVGSLLMVGLTKTFGTDQFLLNRISVLVVTMGRTNKRGLGIGNRVRHSLVLL